MGGVLSALGYDRDFGQLPETGPALPQVRARVIPGWRSVRLDTATHQLTVPAGVQLDLGATVKGWAADRSAARIAAKLGCGVLVSLGGDTAVAGEPPEGGWRIRVQDVTTTPDEPPRGPSAVVAIRDGGLATSSTTARRWQRGGDVLHHILDPRTALPGGAGLAHRLGRRRHLRRREHRGDRRGHQGPPGLGWLASLNLPARLVEPDGTVHYSRRLARGSRLAAAVTVHRPGQCVAITPKRTISSKFTGTVTHQ